MGTPIKVTSFIVKRNDRCVACVHENVKKFPALKVGGKTKVEMLTFTHGDVTIYVDALTEIRNLEHIFNTLM